MAYVLSGVTVDVDRQAVRPREPARPSREATVASPEMATRAPRPREPAPAPGLAPAAIDKYLGLIAAAKGQQARLEAILKQLGEALKAAQTAQKNAAARNDRAAVQAAAANCLVIQKDVSACIDAIKLCAAQANAAAGSAIQNGATRSETIAASNVATANAAAAAAVAPPVVKLTVLPSVHVPGVPSMMQPAIVPSPFASNTPVSPSAPAMPTIYEGPRANTSPTETFIETRTPSIGPGGDVRAGPDARVIQTPTTADASEPTFKTQDIDVNVSSGSAGTLALVGGGLFLGWLFLRKRGKV